MSTCTTCHKPVMWARTVKTGVAMPFDPEPVPARQHGALVLVPQPRDPARMWAYGLLDLVERVMLRTGRTEASVLAEVQTAYASHVSHFATCPQAAQHRR